MTITGNAEIDAIWKRDEAVISEFLDNTRDLPSAVVEALCLRIGELREFIKMMDSTETEEVDNLNCEGEDMSDVDNGENDPDVEVV